MLRSLWLRLTRRRRLDRDLEDELRFHLEMREQENREAGMPPEEARLEARRRFGNVTYVKETSRELFSFRWFETVWQDLRYGVRNLARSPALALVAIVSLGLGAGVNTAIFSVIHGLFLSEITAVEPERLVHVDVGRANQVSYPNYRDLEASGVFAGLAGYANFELSWQRGDEAERVFGQLVTANFFEVLGVQARTGRVFTAEEARPEISPRTVVLSHRFWQRRLAANPGVLGSTFLLNGQPYTVLGVLPEGYRPVGEYGVAPEMYLPLSSEIPGTLNERDRICVELIGRLPQGMSEQQAKAALEVVALRLEKAYPSENEGFGKVWRTYSMSAAGRFRQVSSEPIALFTSFLAVVVGLVLLIACANVAGLLLARAASRRREIAVRLAIGASRKRLIRQLLTESLLLAALGTGLGLLLNQWLAALISQLQFAAAGPLEPPMAGGGAVLLYAVALIIATTLLCGLAPALAATRVELTPSLKQEEPRLGRGRFTLRRTLVAGQVAVSVIILVTAFLFLRSLRRISQADPGFNATETLSARVNLPPGDPKRFPIDEAIDRLQSIPSVAAASCAAIVPLSFSASGTEVQIEGAPSQAKISARLNAVGPRYFETMQIPLLQGREFGWTDREGASRVAIINETFARRHFAGQSPAGRRLIEGKDRRVLEIVGVVRDSKYGMPGEEAAPVLYRSYLQPPWVRRQPNFLVRAARRPGAVTAAVRREIAALAPSAIIEVKTLEDVVALATLPSRMAAVLLTVLGGLGLLLAMVGLYGVVAYSVARRTAEIGIRMALGASPWKVLRLILGQGLTLVAAGAAMGLALSLVLVQPLRMFLAAGVGPTDPLSFGGVIALFFLAGAAACLIPARRALRVDPMMALRYE